MSAIDDAELEDVTGGEATAASRAWNGFKIAGGSLAVAGGAAGAILCSGGGPPGAIACGAIGASLGLAAGEALGIAVDDVTRPK